MYIPPRQISISVTHCPKEAVTAVGGVLTACGRAEIRDARLRAILLSAKGVSPGVSCSSEANCLIESVQIPAVLELVSVYKMGCLGASERQRPERQQPEVWAVEASAQLNLSALG